VSQDIGALDRMIN